VVGTPPNLAKTVRSLMVELQSCKDDNERMMKEQEKKIEINTVLLQSLSDLQRQMQHEPEVQKHGHISGHTERSTSKKVHPRGKGQSRWTIPLGRKLAVQRDLLEAELVPIPKEDRRSEIFPRVINSKNSGSPNHPPSMVK
jgi:hypothetical protein